ncbi:unnamed protein product, partial [Amoebophrya sp. A25]
KEFLTRAPLWDLLGGTTTTSTSASYSQAVLENQDYMSKSMIIKKDETQTSSSSGQQDKVTNFPAILGKLFSNVRRRFESVHRLSWPKWDSLLVGELGTYRIWQEDMVFPRGRWIINELAGRFQRRNSCHGGTAVMLALAYHIFLFELQLGHALSVLLELAEYILLNPVST